MGNPSNACESWVASPPNCVKPPSVGPTEGAGVLPSRWFTATSTNAYFGRTRAFPAESCRSASSFP
jgi:hypothetical protein